LLFFAVCHFHLKKKKKKKIKKKKNERMRRPEVGEKVLDSEIARRIDLYVSYLYDLCK